MTKKEQQIISDVIISLLNDRDFLGYQLSHANSGMTDEQLDEIASKYYIKNKMMSYDTLLEKSLTLHNLLGDKLDCDNLSVMLGCDLNEASLVLGVIKLAIWAGDLGDKNGLENDD